MGYPRYQASENTPKSVTGAAVRVVAPMSVIIETVQNVEPPRVQVPSQLSLSRSSWDCQLQVDGPASRQERRCIHSLRMLTLLFSLQHFWSKRRASSAQFSKRSSEAIRLGRTASDYKS